MPETTIVIIDDEIELLEGLKAMIGAEFPDLNVLVSTDPIFAINTVGSRETSLVITDVRMPVMDGFSLLDQIKKIDPSVTVVLMTAFGSIEAAVEAVKCGAFDFICKPFDYNYLYKSVQMAIERTTLIRENISLKRRFSDRLNFGNFVGTSKRMQHLYDNIQAVSRTDYTVLVRGESGTGKELTAKAIHKESVRRDGPLVMINCPAIPENLLESELFGHNRGAFTGADFERTGLLIEADGGTICLDEIGDIPVSIQTKLLRFLQEGEVRPLGSTKNVKVNVRIVAMTNQDLEKKIADGLFRSDLFYRLNVVTVNTPRLKDIVEDLPLLVSHFVQLACAEQNIPPKTVAPSVVKALRTRDWPGNVRELQNLLRRAVMFCSRPEITLEVMSGMDETLQCPSVVMSNWQDEMTSYDELSYKDAKEGILRSFSKEYFRSLLEKTNGNVTKAAELSCLSRAALQKIMRRYDIQSSHYRVA